MKQRVWTLAGLIALTLGAAAPLPAAAAADEPVRVAVTTLAGERVSGEVTGYDAEGATLIDDGKEHRLLWRDLAAGDVFATHQQLLTADNPAAWIDLGRLLRSLPGGVTYSESALQVATILDPALEGEAQRVREEVTPPPAPAAESPAPAPDPDPAPTTGAAADGRYAWGVVPGADHAPFLAQTRAFAAEAAAALGVELTEVETEHFLYFTNVPGHKTHHSPRLLDQMYNKACELYGIPRDTPLFRGKCAVFMFATQEQFKRFARMHDGMDWAAGYCQTFGEGDVRIVMFQGDDPGYTLHTMLHETVHGVNWRYREPRPLPLWLEEGIAEWVASNTTGNFRYVKAKQRLGLERLRKTPRLGNGFFEEGGITEAWQYGIAYDMVSTLVSRDEEKFAAFVTAVKDGGDWQQSLREHFGLTLDEFVTKYGELRRIRGLTR